ncbi:transglutaminase domain-containing protein [Terrimonas rubra]|uniref:Transglutaminase domain-containing protein n=1 Tax=Terrimonas rubra TaxID=1035890 RepID=A0ABW6A6S3_9BACT
MHVPLFVRSAKPVIFKTLSVLLCFFLFLHAKAQSAGEEENAPENVAITNYTREFRFEAGTRENPVVIKEVSTKEYLCKSYRTRVTIAEFFGQEETVDDINIQVDSKKYNYKPVAEYYEMDGIFYSDAKVYHFQIPLAKQNSTSRVVFKKTVLDPRYFCNVFFMDHYAIENGSVRIVVPNWMNVELKEYNFSRYGVESAVNKGANETIYTYTFKGLPAISDESSAPGITQYSPHVLVMSKSAANDFGSFTYFKTVKEQYNWYNKLVKELGDETGKLKAQTEAIVAGSQTDEEKVKKVFQWVQDNIRYIAFENGIAGFKPAPAIDVYQKKYGDCKGMANLLTTMLRSINLDARRCWIGTNKIAYDYSTPSLAVDNHMISAWFKNGKPVFLDATEKYIGFGEVAERIQGRQTLIEDGSQYILERVSVATYTQNTAIESRKLTIDGNNLKGTVSHTWIGENKVWLLNQLNSIKQEKKEDAIKNFLADNKKGYEISNMQVHNLNDYNAPLKITYDLVWKNVISNFGKEAYLEVDNRRTYEGFTIDENKRKQPVILPFKNHTIFETEIMLPDNFSAEKLPAVLDIKNQAYRFSITYKKEGRKLLYRREIAIDRTELKPETFTTWNKDIKTLKNFYNEQLELTVK